MPMRNKVDDDIARIEPLWMEAESVLTNDQVK